MIDDETTYRDAQGYVRKNAIDGRSLNRAHLEYLVHDLQIPLAKVAELIGVPRWFMARKAHRLGFRNRQHSQKDGGVLGPSQDRLRGIATASIESQSIDRPAPQDNYHEGERYVIAHAINGVSIGREHLKYLLINLNISFEQLAGMLNCHKELLARKASRWRLRYKRRENKEFEAIPLPPAPGGKAKPPIGRRGNPTKYQMAYAKGKEHLAGLDQLRQKSPTEDDLRYLYNELGLPLRKVAQLYGRSATDISNKLRTAGMDRRTAAEARTSHYNATFFREWSPAMAWVLGLIYTDGWLTGNHVGLASIDRELLEKVRSFVAPRHTIHTQRQSYDRHRTIDNFGINHKGMVADLRRLGLQERKSLVMTFPDVPAEYIRHFIRGCWDGDGGFSYSRSRLMGHYACGSQKFIKRLATELFKLGITRERLTRNASESLVEFKKLFATYSRLGPFPPTIYRRRAQNAFELKIGSSKSLRRLYDLFYLDVDPAMFLLRKYEKLKHFVEARGENPMPTAERTAAIGNL